MAGTDRLFFRSVFIYIIHNIYNFRNNLQCTCRTCFFINNINWRNLFMGNGGRRCELYVAMEAGFIRSMEYNYGNHNYITQPNRSYCLHSIPVPCTHCVQFGIKRIQYDGIFHHHRMFSFLLHIGRNKCVV